NARDLHLAGRIPSINSPLSYEIGISPKVLAPGSVILPPVTYDASSLNRKHKTLATSSALPMRPSRVAPPMTSALKRPFSSPSRKMRVSIGPLVVAFVSQKKISFANNFFNRCHTHGSRALILTPALPYSPAADAVNPMTPCLLDEYAALFGRPWMPAVLATLTIEPPGFGRCGS
ncbi:hypothetical protein T310_9203, partial [Rasamsonia emersonii CBS 393.64]